MPWWIILKFDWSFKGLFKDCQSIIDQKNSMRWLTTVWFWCLQHNQMWTLELVKLFFQHYKFGSFLFLPPFSSSSSFSSSPSCLPFLLQQIHRNRRPAVLLLLCAYFKIFSFRHISIYNSYEVWQFLICLDFLNFMIENGNQHV